MAKPVGLVAREPMSLLRAIDVFVSHGMSASSARSYRLTLDRLARELGPIGTLGLFAGDELEGALVRLWDGLAPATWNRQVATVRSFLRFCQRHGWLPEDLVVRLDRRRERMDRTRAIPLGELERLWRRADIGLREKALWRLLYETAARAGEILALDVDDVDVANKRAVARSKGGDVEFVHFQSGSARLLPRLGV